MTRGARAHAVRWGALTIGVLLFAAALYYINLTLTLDTIRRLGAAIPLALLLSGLWHLVRTWAWSWCFQQPRQVSFLRLARVRLAAEAFSYLTLRGIAGEPLKVVLLDDRVDAREATAAVALERLAYMIGTTLIVGRGLADRPDRAASHAGVVQGLPRLCDRRRTGGAASRAWSSPAVAPTSMRCSPGGTGGSARRSPADAWLASSRQSSGRCWGWSAVSRRASPSS